MKEDVFTWREVRFRAGKRFQAVVAPADNGDSICIVVDGAHVSEYTFAETAQFVAVLSAALKELKRGSEADVVSPHVTRLESERIESGYV